MMDIIIHTQAGIIAGKIKMAWAGKNSVGCTPPRNKKYINKQILVNKN